MTQDELRAAAQTERVIERWLPYLESEFGSLSFWRCSKKWKQEVYRRVARGIAEDIQLISGFTDGP